MSCSAKHFALHVVIKRDPSLFQLWSKRGAKLLFQAPYQRVAERNEMGLLHSKFRMLMTGMANDRLEQFASVKSANNGGDYPGHAGPKIEMVLIQRKWGADRL